MGAAAGGGSVVTAVTPPWASSGATSLGRSWPDYRVLPDGRWGPFLPSGRQGWDGAPLHNGSLAPLAAQRAVWLARYTARSWRSYPPPAFAVVLDSRGGAATARRTLRDLNASRYVDAVRQ